MFSLWYALLSWKEYKEVLKAPVPTNEKNSEERLETKQKIPGIEPKLINSFNPEPKKNESAPSPQIVAQNSPKTVPSSQTTIMETSFPGTIQISPKATLDPSPKTPRSPSPHPMRPETFDIEYESEETDEEEEEDEEEEDEEPTSVISTTFTDEKRAAANSEDFLTAEKSSLHKESS